MILLGIFRQQQNHLWRLCSPSLNLIRTINTHQPIPTDRALLSPRLPVIVQQPYRTRKLKFSFGYTNYGHRRHVRPPGHHVVQYMQFFFVIIGAYALFYLT